MTKANESKKKYKYKKNKNRNRILKAKVWRKQHPQKQGNSMSQMMQSPSGPIS